MGRFQPTKRSRGFRDDLLSFLETKGWEFSTDKWTDDIYGYEYPWSKVGFHSKSDLQMSLQFNRNMIELNVFQTIYPADREAEKGRWSFGQYAVMTYPMQQYFKLLVLQVSKFLNVELKDIDRKTLAVDFVLRDSKESWHKTGVDRLEDLDECKYTEVDADGKELRNGQVKYFYRFGKLCKGTIYHHINNMWWVIMGKFDVTNIASFNLFDYQGQPYVNPELRRSALESKLKEAIKEMRFLDAEKFKNLLNKDKEKLYRVWSIKHSSWWASSNSGYTDDVSNAGIYKESEIRQNYHNNGVDSKIVEI